MTEVNTADVEFDQVKGSETKDIPLSLIERSEAALREIQSDTEEYQNLLKSIQQRGVLNSILVRPFTVPGTETVRYILIDGLQRYSCCMELGHITIPARVVHANEADALEHQIVTNVTRVPNRRADVGKALLRVLANNPMMTESELADKLNQSVTFIQQHLSLNKLTPEGKKLVNDGKISLTNAYILSKLPPEEQPEHHAAAMTETHAQFVPRMKERLKEIQAAKRAGKDTTEFVWKPSMAVRPASIIKEQFGMLESGNANSELLEAVAKTGAKTPSDIIKHTLAWCLNMDAESVERQRNEYETRMKKNAELKIRREQQRKDEAERRKQERMESLI